MNEYNYVLHSKYDKKMQKTRQVKQAEQKLSASKQASVQKFQFQIHERSIIQESKHEREKKTQGTKKAHICAVDQIKS
ncbi:hypothetical protein BJ165DRAFT_1486032 [Panaeolus papilionaceus]|nr:hypothetical protein BJ165DRAFT_1486032 [Panaeolus papilionaceus]